MEDLMIPLDRAEEPRIAGVLLCAVAGDAAVLHSAVAIVQADRQGLGVVGQEDGR